MHDILQNANHILILIRIRFIHSLEKINLKINSICKYLQRSDLHFIILDIFRTYKEIQSNKKMNNFKINNEIPWPV